MIKLNRGLIMNYRFFILVTILFFSCEQPDVGLGDGCESLIIDNYSENTQINLEQNSEESVTLTFKHLDCIKNYIISRKITTASDFEQIALLSEENWDLDNKEIIYTDFGDINYNYTYIYKVYGLDPIGNMSSQLINTIVPIFNAEILLNEIELDESDLKITWDFNLNNNVEIDYDFEIEWKTNSNADFELLDIIEDQNINEYSFIPESGIEPEDYYSFRIRIMTEYGNYSDWSEESKWQGINEPPVLDEISNQSIYEDQSIEIYLNATDPNNDILSYSVFSNEFEIQ